MKGTVTNPNDIQYPVRIDGFEYIYDAADQYVCETGDYNISVFIVKLLNERHEYRTRENNLVCKPVRFPTICEHVDEPCDC